MVRPYSLPFLQFWRYQKSLSDSSENIQALILYAGDLVESVSSRKYSVATERKSEVHFTDTRHYDQSSCSCFWRLWAFAESDGWWSGPVEHTTDPESGQSHWILAIENFPHSQSHWFSFESFFHFTSASKMQRSHLLFSLFFSFLWVIENASWPNHCPHLP